MVRPTESIRQEHVEVRQHLDEIAERVGTLSDVGPEAQREVMKETAAFLAEHIVPHAEWEEQALYPAVDRRACRGEHRFTESMRLEHEIVGRWIDELSAMAVSEQADPVEFMRKTDKLLGLLDAHFQAEEQVLLPILDASMTAEEFEREVGHR